MKTLTWADFAKHEPCYNPAEKYGEWEGTILDLMQHPEIPAKDKVWAFTREGIVGDKTLRLFAVGCARKVQHLMKDQRSIDAINVAERYANGNATEDELAAARKVAWDAALDAIGDAAQAAALAAAWASACASAWDAAQAAALAAAWASACASAENGGFAAAREAQVKIAIELLNKPR
jgi:hypothetical protein